VGNADIAPTVAWLLDLDLAARGKVAGRVLTEAVAAHGAPAANGSVTILNWQEAGGERYFDAAGMPGRTIGLAN
jgi:hypothetical protein